tara:strand:+ start:7148 stop:7333 length:186 start_codon:yes stop_codon:yes gene_type:complete
LKDAFASNAEFVTERVESALGGDALASTIEDGHGVVIDCRDLIAIEIDETHTLNGDHLSVA